VAGTETDLRFRVLVHLRRDETLDGGTGVEDAKGRVARIDKPRGGIYGFLQDVLQ
jgi:hypothetical protein